MAKPRGKVVGWVVWRGEEVGMAWVGGCRLFWKSWRVSGPRLKSCHNYSISMLSCASVFLYSSNLSQPTRHMRPSEKEPVRAPLWPQPSTSLPSSSHWLSAVDESQRKARGIMGAASALVALALIDITLAMWLLLKISLSGREEMLKWEYMLSDF